MHYNNFNAAVYMPAWLASYITYEKLAYDYDFLEKYIGLDKVYLETHRDGKTVDKEQLLMIKNFLESNGVTVSGGITFTLPDQEGEEAKRRIFNNVCYTDPKMRARVKEITEYTASFFDEIILDDFYFTSCTCPNCISLKGERDWASFRRALMKEVSEDLVVGPAKSINPNVKMVIKYPNWRESYHFSGYLPDIQQDIFDASYIGTETRSPKYADQHLPEYLSYSIVRYMDNAWPGRNGGGWFDTYSCWSADRYLEQAYLTALAKTPELTLFQWSDLIDNYFTGGMGIEFKKLDFIAGHTGQPTGIPVYIPYSSSGENHLEMRLGMCGFPMDPTPIFPAGDKTILLTESASDDKDIVDKLSDFVINGGEAVITSGFLRKCQEQLAQKGLTEANVTSRKILVSRYQLTASDSGFIDGCDPIIFSEIHHYNNVSWSLVNGGDKDYHTPILLMSLYGKGKIYIINVPDNQSDIYDLPIEVMTQLKKIFNPDDFSSGKDYSVFTYDDGSFVFYRYVKEPLRPSQVKLYTSKEVSVLLDVISGDMIEAREEIIKEDYTETRYRVADITLEPGRYRWLQWK